VIGLHGTLPCSFRQRPTKDWLCRFTSNRTYPDPVEEIDALCTLDDDGEQAFLLLADRSAPPLCGASCGDIVGLCTSQNGRLILHGTGVIAGACIRGDTPPTVQPLYGKLSNRVFSPLKDLVRQHSNELDEATLSKQDQEAFLKGQSFVKRISAGKPVGRKRVGPGQTKPKGDGQSTLAFPSVTLPKSASPFLVVGLDPTAGTWASKMCEGPKEMPSFALVWDGEGFHPDKEPLHWHSTNLAFWTLVQSGQAGLTCIDGPCGTNGCRLFADLSAWDSNGSDGTRSGELQLSQEGINLFWTTQNTVLRFEGASRWIARSLILFSETPEFQKIETHPHGAFTYLWRMFGNSGTPPKKSKNPGRQARLAVLRSFIPGLTEAMVPNHDAVDAACAALVAGLHQLGLTKSFGTVNDGGVIWMPDTVRLARMIQAKRVT
jgi:hypothetical protein